MKLHFLGANRQVTGSRYCLETEGRELLIDCGLFQERQYQSRNWDPCPIPAEQVDAMVLTHVHIDHSGLIPKFVREGYTGPIHCTKPTAALVEIMLRDSAKIQTEDAEYTSRRRSCPT
jgi:metallo-beta-lactamase family protein